MPRRAVVIEINEIPLRVIGDVAARGRAPFLKSMIDDRLFVETRISESLDRELYPSQTWASVGTGVPFAEHGVWWYNDPKPVEYPFYWQLAAAERSVGLVNVLHSSPVAGQCRSGDFRFVVPDCFATDSAAIPERYESFQRLNLELTERNSRQSRLALDPSQLKLVADGLRHLPLRVSTAATLARLVGGVAAGRVPKERVRSAQFLLLSDLFLRLLNDEAPDLAVFFTNHVAAAMHRYWYALFPDDFTTSHYNEDWVERHSNEIVFAVELLDRFLADVARWCRVNDRVLILVSSMGQGPSSRLDSSRSLEAVVRSPRVFLDAVGVSDSCEVLAAMTPNLTLRFPSEAAAAGAAIALEELSAGRPDAGVDQSGPVITFTYDLEVLDEHTVALGGSVGRAETVGVEILSVDDHSSGRHTPVGTLGVFNSDRFTADGLSQVDVFEIAPAMLTLLGVEVAAKHLTPGVVF